MGVKRRDFKIRDFLTSLKFWFEIYFVSWFFHRVGLSSKIPVYYKPIFSIRMQFLPCFPKYQSYPRYNNNIFLSFVFNLHIIKKCQVSNVKQKIFLNIKNWKNSILSNRLTHPSEKWRKTPSHTLESKDVGMGMCLSVVVCGNYPVNDFVNQIFNCWFCFSCCCLFLCFFVCFLFFGGYLLMAFHILWGA